MIRGTAGRYLLWQIWDRTGPRILAAWFIALALTALIHTAIKNGAPPDETLQVMMAQMHQQILWIAIIMMVHGIVASDRTLGFFRFYFAKPISPVYNETTPHSPATNGRINPNHSSSWTRNVGN